MKKYIQDEQYYSYLLPKNGLYKEYYPSITGGMIDTIITSYGFTDKLKKFHKELVKKFNTDLTK